MLAYNRCFCDACLENNLRTLSLDYQIRYVVLQNVVLKIRPKPTSLVDIALQKVAQQNAVNCCYNRYNNHYWLSDGLHTECGITHTVCGLIKPRNGHFSSKEIHWRDLPPGQTYLILFLGEYLELYGIPGYIIKVYSYPEGVIYNPAYLYFIAKRQSDDLFTMMVFDKNFTQWL